LSHSTGPAAEQARRDFVDLINQKGHAVDNAHAAMARLEVAFAEGALVRTAEVDQTLADLRIALERDEGQKLGGKSAEAARFITRALARLIEDA
jgi:hypothetical protein